MKINDLDERHSLRVWVKSVLRTSKMAQQLRMGATKMILKFDPQNLHSGRREPTPEIVL